MACQGDPIECGHEAAMGVLQMRLEQAIFRLGLLKDATANRHEICRLKGKIEGVKMALSYAERA